MTLDAYKVLRMLSVYKTTTLSSTVRKEKQAENPPVSNKTLGHIFTYLELANTPSPQHGPQCSPRKNSLLSKKNKTKQNPTKNDSKKDPTTNKRQCLLPLDFGNHPSDCLTPGQPSPIDQNATSGDDWERTTHNQPPPESREHPVQNNNSGQSNTAITAAVSPKPQQLLHFQGASTSKEV